MTNGSREYWSLMQAIANLKLHDHLCLIYESQDQQLAAALAFMRAGLDAGQRCLYIVDENTADTILEAMADQGMAVDDALRRGALLIRTKRDAYLMRGHFDPDWMISFLGQAVDQAKADGFTALRVTGEMTWALGPEPGLDRLIEYEAKLNLAFERLDCLAICQYNRNRFSPRIIRDIIRTHPLVIYNNLVCHNFYYVPPGEMLNPDPQREVSRLLSNIAERQAIAHQLEIQGEIVGKMAEGVCLIKSEDRIIAYASPKFEALYGYQPGELQAQSLEMLLPASGPISPRQALNDLARLIQESGEATTVVRQVKKDGASFWCRVACTAAQHWQHGQVWICLVADVTPQKEAQLALRQSQEKFEALASLAPVGIFMTDAGGDCQYVNQRWCELAGMTPEQAMGQGWTEALHPQDREMVAQAWYEAAQSGEEFRLNYRFQTSGGQVSWLAGRATKLEDAAGRTTGYLGAVQDITELKRSNQALRRSEALLRETQRLSKVGGWQWDPAARAMFWSREVYRIHDLNPEEWTPGSPEHVQASLACYDPPDRPRILAAFESCARDGRPYDLELPFTSAHGRRLWIRTTAHAIMEEGRVVKVVGNLMDITQHKQEQERRQRLEEQLRQSLKMEAIGTLAGGIAHDFNNILAAIVGFTELALDQAGQGIDCREELRDVLKASARAKELVGQILTFSRKAEVVLRSLDLNQEVGKAVRLVEKGLPKMISIQQRLGPQPVRVRANPNQIEQVLMNLCSNAGDAMPDGGRIIISTHNARVEQTKCSACGRFFSGQFARLTVRDHGQGMTPETMAKMFDPFFTTKSVGKGTGLGLSTVYGILESHGGHLVCQSQPDQGTSFTLYLPTHQDPGPEYQGGQEPRPALPRGNETILLVDDEESLRSIGVKILTRQGYDLLTAQSGEQALALYWEQGSRIDLVILDISMPGMGGHRCLEELRKLDPAAKVVITSGYARDGRIQETLACGAAGYLAKPFTKSQLLDLVRQALDQNP